MEPVMFPVEVLPCPECGAALVRTEDGVVCPACGYEETDVWAIYEQRKCALQRAGLSSEEYERAILALAKELGV